MLTSRVMMTVAPLCGAADGSLKAAGASAVSTCGVGLSYLNVYFVLRGCFDSHSASHRRRSAGGKGGKGQVAAAAGPVAVCWLQEQSGETGARTQRKTPLTNEGSGSQKTNTLAQLTDEPSVERA